MGEVGPAPGGRAWVRVGGGMYVILGGERDKMVILGGGQRTGRVRAGPLAIYLNVVPVFPDICTYDKGWC